MIQVEDIKVLSINTFCMVAFHITNVNQYLQSILLLGTIGYTIVRTINELDKYRDNKNGKGIDNEDKG
jgi:hypothetical protein